MSEPLSADCHQALERATALLEVQGAYALRAQAQQQAALELLQARRLGADEAQLSEVLLQRIRASVAQLLESVEPPVSTAVMPSPSGCTPPALIMRVEALITQLEGGGSEALQDPQPWTLAVACHQQMLALQDKDRLAAIAYAVAGGRLIGELRQRGVSLPDWLLHHEEQLCRYGGLWIHQRLRAPGPEGLGGDDRSLAREGLRLLTRLDAIHAGAHAWVGHHLAMLKQHAAGAATGRSLTIAMAGNCQYWPLYLYMKELLPAARFEAGPTVHLATAQEVEAFHGQLAGVDVLLVHRIQPGYRNDIGLDNQTLARHLPVGARQLLLPNIHYEGHHPWIGYAHDPQGQLQGLEATSPLGPYHDFLAMQAARSGLTAEAILSTPLLPAIADRIRRHHHDSLEQLRRREVDCDVAISSWIERYHQQVPVAHTCNHPTPAALHALLLQLLQQLDPTARVDPSVLDSRDYLGALSIPILPWVRQALELEPWANDWGQRDGKKPFPIEVQLTASIAFYRQHPWIAEQNQQHEKLRAAADVLAVLSPAPGSGP